MTLAHQGLLHAAFDAGGRPLDPLQLLRLRQHLGEHTPIVASAAAISRGVAAEMSMSFARGATC